MRLRWLKAWGCGIGMICAVFAQAAPAAAAGVAAEGVADGASERASLPSVEIAVVGDFPNADAVGKRVASWFEGQSIVTRTSRVADLSAKSVFTSNDSVGVRLWLVLSAPTDARLFFAVQERAGVTARYLVQDVELSGGVDELGLERLAQVAYLSAVALWEGNAESTRADLEQRLPVATPSRSAAPQRSKAPPRPAKAPDESWRWRYEQRWEARFHGEEGIFYGLGNAFGPKWPRGRSELSILGYFGFYLPHEVERTGITLDCSAFAFGLPLGVARRVSDSFWLSFELGPFLSAGGCRTKALSDPSLVNSTSSGGLWRPEVMGSVALWLDFGPFRYALTIGAGVPLMQAHYDIQDSAVPGGREELLVPWAVQPAVSLGITR